MSKGERVVGAHIAAGITWIAVVETDGSLVEDPTSRIELKESLPLARALAEMQESAEHFLSRISAAALVLVRAGSSRNPSQNDLLRRGRIEGSLMVAAHRSGARFDDITHDRIAKAYGLRPTDAAFSHTMAEVLGTEPPTRWKERSPGFAAALLATEVQG